MVTESLFEIESFEIKIGSWREYRTVHVRATAHYRGRLSSLVYEMHGGQQGFYFMYRTLIQVDKDHPQTISINRQTP